MPSGTGLLARERVIQLVGFGIGLLAVLTTLALLTFNASDPSLNTATTRSASNWIGAPGALWADLLLQSFGVAAYLVPLILGHWAAACLFHMERSPVVLRAFVAFPAVLMLAAVLSSLPFQSDWSKPASAGGAGGMLVLENFQRWLFLPKALSTVICFVAGALALIYALGLEGSLMSAYRKERTDRGRRDHAWDDEEDDLRFDNGADPVVADPWSSMDMEPEFETEPFFEEEEAQEVYSDPQAVRVRLAETDTVYVPDSERDDFTVDMTPPASSVEIYGEDQPGSSDHAGRAYGQTTYGVRLDAAETVTSAWSFLKPKTEPKPEMADPWLENLAPDELDDPFEDERDKVPVAKPSKAQQHVNAALNEAPRRVTRIGVPATNPQPSYSGPFQAPKVDLLVYPEDVEQKGLSAQELEARIEQLEQALDEFKIKGRVVNARPGPVVTLFEFAPAPGQRIARVVSLADDIKRAMAAHSTRIAVVPGTSVIGIELPNETRTPVNLRQIIDSDAFSEAKARLPLALGIDIAGNPTVADLARAPHLLIAGTTGSGKSVSLNGMILSLLYALPPERLKLIMIDPKMLELSLYDRIPHLLSPVVTDPRRAIVALKWAVREMEDRYETMMKLEV
ncbi:MAG: DNA translocase FtsK 4TM domain-containing protein, partial [Alphaproteobacteria bacterium]